MALKKLEKEHAVTRSDSKLMYSTKHGGSKGTDVGTVLHPTEGTSLLQTGLRVSFVWKLVMLQIFFFFLF